ncbi:hypothetical protein KIN20_028448 [Parelaphostrongylus tenuis]|uniref:Uncharacterized protein n=1 Tax=Parelaphostrongylus tenuis TaxID=148309 RepID=A0AAD5R0U9_PARTN|nr:hypothetical protein KIN20_028448 [Parelaphostrongylus tenuis]
MRVGSHRTRNHGDSGIEAPIPLQKHESYRARFWNHCGNKFDEYGHELQSTRPCGLRHSCGMRPPPSTGSRHRPPPTVGGTSFKGPPSLSSSTQ